MLDTLDAFLRAYLECALWSSVGEDQAPLDDGRDASDIAPESIEQARTECDVFKAQAGALLDDWEDSQAGHDFWLTRNHHGAGFWDRDIGTEDTREQLTKLSEAAGERYAYIGDDGNVYIEG